MVQIPLQSIPSQRLQVVLGGQNVTLAFYWRFGRLYCDLSVDAIQVLGGQLCLDMQPFPPYPTLNFKGKLFFVDTLGNSYPQWNGLGERWQLCYLSEDETLESVISGAVANA